MKKNYFTFLVLGICLLFIGGIWYAKNKQGSELKPLASCLKEKGATMYGTFWCSHCQNQKKLFGSAQKYLPYVECSTPDAQGQTPICAEKNITSYPTWVFADGSQVSGEQTLEFLAEKTGCTLPQ